MNSPHEFNSDDGINIEKIDENLLDEIYRNFEKSLENQIIFSNHLSDKSMQLIQLNGIILSILITTASYFYLVTPNIGIFSDIIFLASALIGITMIVFSLLTAINSYRLDPMVIGTNYSDVRKALNNNINSREQYIRWIVFKGYTNWIDENNKSLHRKSLFIEISLYAFFFGLLMLVAAIVFFSNQGVFS